MIPWGGQGMGMEPPQNQYGNDNMQGLMRAFQGMRKPQMQQSYQPYNNAYDNAGG